MSAGDLVNQRKPETVSLSAARCLSAPETVTRVRKFGTRHPHALVVNLDCGVCAEHPDAHPHRIVDGTELARIVDEIADRSAQQLFATADAHTVSATTNAAATVTRWRIDDDRCERGLPSGCLGCGIRDQSIELDLGEAQG